MSQRDTLVHLFAGGTHDQVWNESITKLYNIIHIYLQKPSQYKQCFSLTITK
ncbi:Hypothetical predicted protein [Pelobates cultripes]|uniref:Uncharacterized protein n=1 Tax=Pelobates cultripes TaxID=61616 RepID=A0AAD1RBI3_PELCU|nr:Hypothetical predicted protein [Pelobates cultripes]